MTTALRPSVTEGVPLAMLVAQLGAVTAEGGGNPEVRITGVTLRAQDVMPGDLFAALPGSSTHSRSTPAAAATSMTSTGSPLPVSHPRTIRAMSSD